MDQNGFWKQVNHVRLNFLKHFSGSKRGPTWDPTCYLSKVNFKILIIFYQVIFRNLFGHFLQSVWKWSVTISKGINFHRFLLLHWNWFISNRGGDENSYCMLQIQKPLVQKYKISKQLRWILNFCIKISSIYFGSIFRFISGQRSFQRPELPHFFIFDTISIHFVCIFSICF